MSFDLEQLDRFPMHPGVYIMKDCKETVIYVGKAKKLRERLKQYFSLGGDERLQVPFLVSRIESIETIVVSSEKEALLLENTLIKKYQPRYNILLKDDKSYVSLMISHKHSWPMIRLLRYKGKPKEEGMYFGPYTNVQAAKQTLNLINRVFPIRQCSDKELLRRKRPCILYHINKCLAPCVNYCSHEEYSEHVKRAIGFLQGKDRNVVDSLYREVRQASEKLEFERAGKIYEIIKQVEKTLELQRVDCIKSALDADVLAIFRQADEVCLSRMIFRKGKLQGASKHHFSKTVQEDREIYSSFIMQYYIDQRDFPREILLPVVLEGVSAIEEFISKESSKIRILFPKRGEKRNLLAMALMNAQTAYHQKRDASIINENILLKMKEKLNLTNYPRRVECFDTSHLSGGERVAAMVVFTDGEKTQGAYRKYCIKNVDLGDDYAMIREVMMRRYRKDRDLPELIIVDGGKGQLNIAKQVLSDMDIVTVDLIALAKEEGRHDRGLTSERIFLQNVKDPIYLKKHSPILFLLQRIRDEAHRVAISFYRHKQRKKTLHSFLDDVPGIGPVKSKRLLKHFGSVKRVKEASEEQLLQVKGLSSKDTNALLLAIKNEKGERLVD